MIKYLLLTLLFVPSAFSATLVWDQPEPGQDQIAAEGWKLFVNNNEVWEGQIRSVDIDSLNLIPGDYSAEVKAYAGEIISDPSNSVAFSIDPVAGAPQEVAPLLTFRNAQRAAGAT